MSILSPQEAISVLNWRYATKSFDPTKQLSSEMLDTLTESLRLSASSFGLQPWKFIVVENPETRAKLREASWGQAQITDASHLIVLCKLTSLDATDVEKFVDRTIHTRNAPPEALADYKNMMLGSVDRANTTGTVHTWMKDQVYIALGTLLTTAAFLGVDTCPMEWFDAQKYNEILGLSGLGLESCVVCPVGYRSADDKYADAKKVRYTKDEVVMKM